MTKEATIIKLRQMLAAVYDRVIKCEAKIAEKDAYIAKLQEELIELKADKYFG